MHINEGSGMITNPSTNLVEFIDEALPGVPGSTVLAEWGNAVTFEMAAIAQAAGLELATSAADDRASGWHQMKTAIFDSGALTAAAIQDLAITTAKIATGAVTTDQVGSLDLAKLFGTLVLTAVTGGDIDQITLNERGIECSSTLFGDTFSAKYTSEGLTGTTSTGEKTKFGGGGMTSVSVGNAAPMKLSAFSLSGTGNWSGSLDRWDGELTGLEKTQRIYHAYVGFERTNLIGDTGGDGSSIYDTPTQYFATTDLNTIFSSVAFNGVDSSEFMQGKVYLTIPYNTADYQNIILYIVHG